MPPWIDVVRSLKRVYKRLDIVRWRIWKGSGPARRKLRLPTYKVAHGKQVLAGNEGTVQMRELGGAQNCGESPNGRTINYRLVEEIYSPLI
jgi:hypothetical protein